MKALAVLLLASALASQATAGTIALTLSQRAEVVAGRLVVHLEIGNQGTEQALSVTPSLALGERSVSGHGQRALAPNDSFEETLSLPIGALGEGRWPYRLRVDYTDTNQYPFQALQVQILSIGSPPPTRVVASIRSVNIESEGVIEVTVKNVSPESRSARVDVVLPDAFRATGASQELALDGWQETAFEVPVTNQDALAGSRHAVFAVAEYEDGGVHQALIAHGQLAVAAPEPFLSRHGRALTLTGAGLLALWLGSLLATLVQRRSGRPA
jgi:hypothetical protein